MEAARTTRLLLLLFGAFAGPAGACGGGDGGAAGGGHAAFLPLLDGFSRCSRRGAGIAAQEPGEFVLKFFDALLNGSGAPELFGRETGD